MGKITKEFLQNAYHQEKKSTRKIAKDLKVGKTTIEYYLKKFEIKTRSLSEANKLHAKDSNWIKGLDKKDPRVKKLAKKIKKTYTIKRKVRFNQTEKRFGKPLKELINELYWKSNLSQEQIAKKIGYNRKIVIDLMRSLKIPKKPKYQYISSLKGEKHSMFGKTWDILYSIEESKKRRKIYSDRFRKLTIKRLENNEFPFFDTKIEKKVANELIKRKIPFIKQFKINNKFVCDFAIPPLKIIIECDGDYWHANPKIYSSKTLTFNQKKNLQRDIFKDKYLNKKGWKIIRLFELEIKNNIKCCTDRIENMIRLQKEELKKIKSPLDSLME